MTLVLTVYALAATALTLMSVQPILETFKSPFDRMLMTLLVWTVSPIWGVFYLAALAKAKLFDEQGINS